MNTIVNNRRTLSWILSGLLVLGLIAALTIPWERLFPKQGCNPATLTLGTQQYIIETIPPEANGSLKVPAEREDTVFWVEGTDTNQAFALSPTTKNLALEAALKTGDQVIVKQANCNSTTYTLSTLQKGTPSLSALLDQSASAITIFIQADSSAAGFTAKGELQAETITTFNTPDASAIQAEISLLETTTSADGKTIRVGVSILNTGQSSITLTANDVSLSSENNTPASAEPALPKEIKAGASETIYFTFPKPSSKTAVLKVFSAEYELEGY